MKKDIENAPWWLKGPTTLEEWKRFLEGYIPPKLENFFRKWIRIVLKKMDGACSLSDDELIREFERIQSKAAYHGCVGAPREGILDVVPNPERSHEEWYMWMFAGEGPDDIFGQLQEDGIIDYLSYVHNESKYEDGYLVTGILEDVIYDTIYNKFGGYEGMKRWVLEERDKMCKGASLTRRRGSRMRIRKKATRTYEVTVKASAWIDEIEIAMEYEAEPMEKSGDGIRFLRSIKDEDVIVVEGFELTPYLTFEVEADSEEEAKRKAKDFVERAGIIVTVRPKGEYTQSQIGFGFED